MVGGMNIYKQGGGGGGGGGKKTITREDHKDPID